MISFLITFIFAQSLMALNSSTVVKKLASNSYSMAIMGYTSLVVVGESEVLITDPANPIRAQVLKKEIKKITSNPVKKIVLSHEHFDHVGGTKTFINASVIAQENVLLKSHLNPLKYLPKIDSTFSKKMVIDLGNTKVELLFLGISDGIGAIVTYLPKEQIVFTADLYVDDGISAAKYNLDTNLLGVRHVFNTLKNMKIKHTVNAHGLNSDPKILMTMNNFYNDLYDFVVPKVQETMKKFGARKFLMEFEKIANEKKFPKYKNMSNYKDLPRYIMHMGTDVTHGG